MGDLIGGKGEENLSRIGFTKQMVSMGHQACGALELWNYPIWMRNLVAQDVDLAALESKLTLLKFISSFEFCLDGMKFIGTEKEALLGTMIFQGECCKFLFQNGKI